MSGRHVYVIQMSVAGTPWQPLPAIDGRAVVAFRKRKDAQEALKNNGWRDPFAVCPPIVMGEQMRYRIVRYVNP